MADECPEETAGPEAPGIDPGATARRAAAWLIRHPGVSVPAAAGLAVWIACAIITRSIITDVMAGVIASSAAAAAIARLDRSRAHGKPPGNTIEALRLADLILAKIHPWSGPVTAADANTITVDWDPPVWVSEGSYHGYMADQMLITCRVFRDEAFRRGVLHQLPPSLMLVAGDGTVAEVFGPGGLGRTGVIVDDARSAGTGPAMQPGFNR